MVVGDIVEGRASSSRAAVEGRVAAAHLGARRLGAAASAGMEKERASQGSCCCPPLRKVRSAWEEGASRALQRIDGKRVLSMIDRTVVRYARSKKRAFALRREGSMPTVANEGC
jgi:hypothetical protein